MYIYTIDSHKICQYTVVLVKLLALSLICWGYNGLVLMSVI